MYAAFQLFYYHLRTMNDDDVDEERKVLCAPSMYVWYGMVFVLLGSLLIAISWNMCTAKAFCVFCGQEKKNPFQRRDQGQRGGGRALNK